MALNLAVAKVCTSQVPLVRCASGIAKCKEVLMKELDAIREAGTWKSERIVTTPQAARIRVEGTDRPLLNFCANNYLGLSSHPDVIAAAKQALNDYGAGLGSGRIVCGTHVIHKELEQKIAQFHNKDDAILYATCFGANTGIFETIMSSKEDATFTDQFNHPSVINGLHLCNARKYCYDHKDLLELEKMLQESSDARLKMIVTDGVFSMDGDIADIPQLCDLADKYGAMVFSDECHATGLMGKTGRGTDEHFGCEGRIDIINSTLGKALGGGAGGYTAAPKEIITMLRQRSRPYVFSNSLPPPVVAGASKVFDLLMNGSELVEKLQYNTNHFRKRMLEAGFTLKGETHPIAPVMFGDARFALECANELLKKGIYVIGFSYPVVPKGEARIRVQLSALHDIADINMCVDAFIDVTQHRS